MVTALGALATLAALSASILASPGSPAPADASGAASSGAAAEVSGELKTWHRVTLTFDGPETSEAATPSPFLDYRLDVVFSLGAGAPPTGTGRTGTTRAGTTGGKARKVPGFYAADGAAAETGAASGRKWRAHFAPDAEGTWAYEATLRRGPGIAVAEDLQAGEVVGRYSGSFAIGPAERNTRADKTDQADQAGAPGPDLRSRGLLEYVGERYLRFAGTGERYLKGGADSPENFLAFADFDGTYDDEALDREGEAKGGKFLHTYAPHVRDWREGDPTWRGGKGKGIVGALNYLASKGMNSVYFLTMNVAGDGKDVWPWTGPRERLRFDASKLDQWEIVFSHMDRLGLLLHVITQETENDQILDGGELGVERKLYYRELVARFSHHLALVWNLGEENTNTDLQRKAFAKHLRELDPYDHAIVVHTYPGKYDEVYEPLLGYPFFEGPSLQTNDTHAQTVRWVERSAAAGRPWVVCLDEIGPPEIGVKPDSEDFWHDQVRKLHLWGNLMAGGAGVEWYLGYRYPDNDLKCEDWRTRDHLWDLTRIALDFFRVHLPYARMRPADGLLPGAPGSGYCLAAPGEVYAAYLFGGGKAELDLGEVRETSVLEVKWYDPRQGGDLLDGSVREVRGPGKVALGAPPRDPEKDWVAIVRAPGGSRSSSKAPGSSNVGKE